MIIQPSPTGVRASALPHHRRSNAFVTSAMSAVPGLDQTMTMLDNLIETSKTLEPAASVEDVTNTIYDTLAEGAAVPGDVVARYAEAAAHEQAFLATQANLNGLATTLVQQRDNLIHGGLGTMCEYLNEELQRVYAGLRAIPGPLTTPEQAIADGKVAAYKKAAGLREEYREIRTAQRHLFASGLTAYDDELFRHLSKAWPIVAYASGLGAVWTKLPEWWKYGKEQVEGGRMVRLTPPWPDPDTDAFTDWLIAHPDANPWVPTFDQAAELLNQIIKAAPTYYDTNRSPDQHERDAEHKRRKRMWSQPAALVS